MRLIGPVLVLSLFALSAVSAQGPAGALRVGAARVDITPAAESGGPPATYAHERLYVRAIVIDNGSTRAVLIGADQGNMPEPVWDAASRAIAAELNVPVSHILMSATHTHSSSLTPPGARGAVPPTPAAASVPPALVAPMLQAVRQARATLQPARVGFGTGSSWLNVNRDAIDDETRQWTQAPNLEGHSDKTVAVLKFESMAGRPIAVYVNYAMHPVNGYLAGFVSGDFPGAATRHIEQAYGDEVVAVFSQGASGDQNPLHLRAGTNVMASRSGVPVTGSVLVREKVEGPLREGTVPSRAADATTRDRLLRWIESQGMLLGEETIRAMTQITSMDASPRIAGAQQMITCPGRTRIDGGREGRPGQYAVGDPVSLRLGVLAFGSIVLSSVNAELYSPIGRLLKERSPLTSTVLVTLANGRATSGYVPDDASFGRYTFQVNGSRLQPGCAEQAIVGGLTGMIAGLN